MNLLALVGALVLGGLPYPPPRLVVPTDATKCDTGTILSVDAQRSELRMNTPAGPIVYRVGPDVQVFSADGKPAGSLSALSAGQRARVYYVIDDGARVAEIDLQ
ncbi:hypothetical protein [Anaeromyxobacter oryzae]|uniref:Uncharacterized protein n=1 Tax=Anaeromyxobacter oryzae TaxID=2918170 RepID=A0ABN6MSV1_9BACT|nr:hypothetical protein [Anaeromyxobacter oryzae]BDG02518.1 hypothetical protein AMOR_15140 [Anaeromyxobacter oryzae]